MTQREKGRPVIDRSEQYYSRSLGLIPGATQTLAKGPSQYVNGVAPKYLQRGRGCHVWDVDSNEYIDLTMAVGPISLGYCYPAVDDAIRSQLSDGINFSLMHPLEVEVAEMIQAIIPNAEMVRFSKTGADVTSAAVRLARAYTGRDKILCCGYHGWHDWYISVTDRHLGVPDAMRDLTNTFRYNDVDSLLNSADRETAAIILEPVTFEAPNPGFLETLRIVADELGIVLIFDEMWTGFRISPGGAQQHFNISADLACFSKAIANGMPLSVLAGKRNIMQLLEQDVFFFTTFGGEALSLAAAKATIREIVDRSVPDHIARQNRKLRDGYNTIANQLGMAYTRCAGLDYRTLIQFDPGRANPLEMKSLVQQELIRRGVLWSGFHNLSHSHTNEDISDVLTAYGAVLPILREAVEENRVRESISGVPVQPSFRLIAGFNSKPLPQGTALR